MRGGPFTFGKAAVEFSFSLYYNWHKFAKTLRDRGDEVRILFITGAAEYALEGYQVNPIHYLLKPVNQQELERVLVGDWERNHRSKTLLFRQGTKWVALASTSRASTATWWSTQTRPSTPFP